MDCFLRLLSKHVVFGVLCGMRLIYILLWSRFFMVYFERVLFSLFSIVYGVVFILMLYCSL